MLSVRRRPTLSPRYAVHRYAYFPSASICKTFSGGQADYSGSAFEQTLLVFFEAREFQRLKNTLVSLTMDKLTPFSRPPGALDRTGTREKTLSVQIMQEYMSPITRESSSHLNVFTN